MKTIVYDSAVLIAADRNDRQAWADHKARLKLGAIPLVPAPVVAHVSRSSHQAQLRRFLTGCTVVPFGEKDAHAAGRLMAKTKTKDIVDASVVTLAAHTGAVILTGDVDDLSRLASAAAGEIAVVGV